MEIKFNSGKNESIGPATRTYNPASRKNRRYGEGDFPVPVRMESDRDETVSFLRSEIRFSDFSKILILISVFMVALGHYACYTVTRCYPDVVVLVFYHSADIIVAQSLFLCEYGHVVNLAVQYVYSFTRAYPD
jgi:hypothetical protein